MNKQISEVEKLYKLAELNNLWLEEYYASDNVHPVQIWHKSYNEMIKSMMETNAWARSEAIEVAKKECRKALPPFTAEKQLELIKLLQRKNGYKFIPSSTNDNSEYLFFAHKDNTSVQDLIVAGDKCYEEALAGFINILWQDLTEDEKQQVKGILE